MDACFLFLLIIILVCRRVLKAPSGTLRKDDGCGTSVVTGRNMFVECSGLAKAQMQLTNLEGFGNMGLGHLGQTHVDLVRTMAAIKVVDFDFDVLAENHHR